MRATSTSTNLLVAKLKGSFRRFAAPAGATAVLLFAVCFLINRGGATAADFMELAHRVREAVFKASGVKLEEEVRIVGEEP